MRDLDALVFLLAELNDKPEAAQIKKLFSTKLGNSSLSTFNDATLVAESGSSGTGGSNSSKLSSTALAEVKCKIISKIKYSLTKLSNQDEGKGLEGHCHSWWGDYFITNSAIVNF